MTKIIPHLWFDQEAKEAALFYSKIFPESETTGVRIVKDTPSGDCETVFFKLWGQEFQAISAGPLFKFNPSISFIVNFDPLFFKDHANSKDAAKRKLTEAWEELVKDGKELMPLQEYPFSERYGWVEDKYGLSWQLMLTDPQGENRPPIIPSLMFTGPNLGKAEAARSFYLSIFKNSKPGLLVPYEKDMERDKKGTIMFSDFMLENTWFTAMDSGFPHAFKFNESISFMVECKNQEEIDYYWQGLSFRPENEECGWLKDKYGVSWQIVPEFLNETLLSGKEEEVDRAVKSFLKMKKLDIEQIKSAIYGG